MQVLQWHEHGKTIDAGPAGYLSGYALSTSCLFLGCECVGLAMSRRVLVSVEVIADGRVDYCLVRDGVLLCLAAICCRSILTILSVPSLPTYLWRN